MKFNYLIVLVDKIIVHVAVSLQLGNLDNFIDTTLKYTIKSDKFINVIKRSKDTYSNKEHIS